MVNAVANSIPGSFPARASTRCSATGSRTRSRASGSLGLNVSRRDAATGAPLDQPPLREADRQAPGATMKWSSTLTSTSASASASVRVSAWSWRLGSATPEGWLCARITAAALCASACLTHLARIDARLRERAAEELLGGDHAVLRVEEHAVEASCPSSCMRRRRYPRTAPGEVRLSRACISSESARRASSITAANLRVLGRARAGHLRRTRPRAAASSVRNAAEAGQQLAGDLHRALAAHPGAAGRARAAPHPKAPPRPAPAGARAAVPRRGHRRSTCRASHRGKMRSWTRT